MHHDTEIKAIKEVIRDLMFNELLPVVLKAIGSADQPEPPLVSRQDAARQLGVSIQTIAALIRDGSIEHVRVRRRVLISQHSLIAYMNRQSLHHVEGDGR